MFKYDGFVDCKIKRIELEPAGYKIIVPANPEKGFSFPYVLYIPDDIDEKTSLIVEGPNAVDSKKNIEEGVKAVIDESMDRKIVIWNNVTNFPILTPAFPRFYDDVAGAIYTHMLTSKALNFKYNLDIRIDYQLINMISDLKERFSKSGISIDEKVILDGFSASAKFVNRFALLHPEIVKLVIAGGISGTCILPVRQINNESLLYPIGCGNMDEIIDEKIEAFKQLKQFYYMGELDINNDPFQVNDDGNIVYYGPIEEAEAKQLCRMLGYKMMPDRWKKTQQFYNELGVNATFKTYDGFGHDPFPAEADVKQLLSEFKTLTKK